MKRIRRVVRAAKVAVAYGLYYSGVLELWRRLTQRHQAIVLTYHRVLTADERSRSASHPAYCIGADAFARQMAFLRRKFTVLSLSQFSQILADGRRFPERACLITFDDGWRDNVTNAWPVLERERLSATIFLPTAFIGARQLFWRESLTHLLVRAILLVRQDPSRRTSLDAVLQPFGLHDILDLRAEPLRPAVIDALAARRSSTERVPEQLVDMLGACLGAGVADAELDVDGYMDWTQVRTLGEGGITFGAHGVNHQPLTQLSEAAARTELDESRAILDQRAAPPVRTFSYPNGCWNAALATHAEAAGYAMAFTTEPGAVHPGSHAWALPRINIGQGTEDIPLFFARLVGLF